MLVFKVNDLFSCLLMFKISIGIAKGIAEFDGVGATGGKSNGDDDHLLHGGVYHGAVYHKTCSVVDVVQLNWG